EIDRRKLYLEKGFTSLFDYLTKDFAYSPGAAMRRIDGARLLREIPEITEKIESGSLTLSQANQIQRAARDFKKTKNETLSTEEKRGLLLQIENTTQKQTEHILATTLDLPVITAQKETLHKDQSVTLTITFTSEQIQILEQAQNMISHVVAHKDWAEILTHLAQREVARRTNTRKATQKKPLEKKTLKDFDRELFTAVAAVKPESHNKNKQRPAIPTNLRKSLLHINAECAHRDDQGHPCKNKKFLQIDHIHSWTRGGSHEAQNLQVLCATHNRLKYAQES
ncbi:HNH endonuclease, partial [bacterium]|nr:HNH endonuclease [bacterium]